jgi:hypothetical protein
MANAVDTYIEPLSMDMEEFYLLSDAEREQVYESAIEDLSDEDIEALRSELQEKMDYLVEEFAVQAAELEDIIDSDDSTVEERTRAGVDVEDIEEMKTVAEQFSTEFGDAQSDLAAHSVSTTSAYTVDAGSNVQNGEEFVVDCTESATVSATPDWAEDEHPDWLDTDGDGIGDTDPDEDGDGIADEDFNGDGVISEADAMRDATAETTQVITITVEATDTVRVASYDASTGTVRFSITKEDGTVYYVTVQSGADAMPDIKFTSSAALHAEDFTDLDMELVNRIYTDVSTEYSLGHYLGMDDGSDAAEGYYTIIDMNDQDENECDITPTDADFENGRSYEINCQSGKADDINFTFEETDEIEFSKNDDGDLVMTVTRDGNEITITIKNFSYGWASDSTTYDVLNILGGQIDENDWDALSGEFWGMNDSYQFYCISDFISHDGTSITDEETADGYAWIDHIA